MLPTWLVSGEARAHVKVALSGDGADELFAGYETFRADRVHGLLARLPAWPLRPMLRKAVEFLPVRHGKVPFAERARRFVGGLDLTPADAHLHWRALQSHGDALACLLPEARAGLEASDPGERARALDAEVAACDRVNRASYMDAMTYLPDDILVKVDRASMAHGLEARCPFLDHRFVEAAARLPGDLKLRFMTTKWILRRQHSRRLPATTLLRPKRGFSSPVARWLLGPLRETFHDLVTPARMAPLGLDAAEAHRRLGDLRQRRAYHGYTLWAVLVIAAWDAQRRRAEPPARG